MGDRCLACGRKDSGVVFQMCLPARKDGLIGIDRRCVNAKLGPFGALCDVRVGCALDGSKSQRLSDDDVED